jgi:hypothetical protein
LALPSLNEREVLQPESYAASDLQGRQGRAEEQRSLKLKRVKNGVYMQVLEKRSRQKNTASSNSPLRALRPLRETYFVSFLNHFSTPKSEEPKD